jgi:DNA-binding response OmpR family regulator
MLITFNNARIVKRIGENMMNVLYADDERGMLEVGKEFLEMSGKLNVETALSATEALLKMDCNPFDAIVSDYQMPGMDGLQFLRSVRNQDKKLPFILFTGKGREDVVIEACNAGVSSYLQKGGDAASMFAELENRIEQAVSRRRSDQALLIKNLQANLAIDLAKIATWEYDPDTMLFKFDDLFFRLYGKEVSPNRVDVFSPEEFVSQLVHPDDREMVVEWLKRECGKICQKDYIQIEHRTVRSDGQVRWMAVRAGALMGPDGHLIKVCGVSHDITDQRMMDLVEMVTPTAPTARCTTDRHGCFLTLDR